MPPPMPRPRKSIHERQGEWRSAESAPGAACLGDDELSGFAQPTAANLPTLSEQQLDLPALIFGTKHRKRN